MTISGIILDPKNNRKYHGTIHINNGYIEHIEEHSQITDNPTRYILPGFVDAHVHIESSMLPPAEFARIALTHGTVATVSDPHEIANVLGIDGVYYMLRNAEQTPMNIAFGAPSCVPATTFETAGATITADDIRELFSDKRVRYLSEMMNYPAVLHRDNSVMEKINIAHQMGRPVDGHAPGLRGDDVQLYASAGISTDHECYTLEEALDKLEAGMSIIIREGSAAKNFEALHSLITTHTSKVMLCSDDKHPDSLVQGHINTIVKRAVAYSHDVMDVLRCACVNPVLHYGLPVGLLQVGDSADFIVVDSLDEFNVLETYINGKRVSYKLDSVTSSSTESHYRTAQSYTQSEVINNFQCTPIDSYQLQVPATSDSIRVIEALDGQLITNQKIEKATVQDGLYVSNIDEDILKVVVVNRYTTAQPAIGFIRGFGFERGAIASSVAHDSHNIIAVGTDDNSIVQAVNKVIACKGGVCVYDGSETTILPLEIAGLMSTKNGYEVAKIYEEIEQIAKGLTANNKTPLSSPFMTLSFMALLVIPSLKMSDLGLFDGSKFEFTTVGV
jgi:adenine deaminase